MVLNGVLILFTGKIAAHGRDAQWLLCSPLDIHRYFICTATVKSNSSKTHVVISKGVWLNLKLIQVQFIWLGFQSPEKKKKIKSEQISSL